MNRFFLVIILFVVHLIWNDSYAQVPRLVHYQGTYQNSDGSPFDGIKNLTFKLYKSRQSETPSWSEVHENVKISEGNYEILLGSQNPLKLSFFEYYLEVQADGEETITPRIAIVGSGYNFRLNFLFAAYTIVWLAIFFYLLSIARRQKRLLSELELLAKQTG